MVRYLHTKYAPSKARAKYQYTICMQKLEELQALNNAKTDFLKNLIASTQLNVVDIDPLISEIFDL